MQTFLKASAAVAVAAMLAACGGGAANTVPSTGTGTTPTSNAQQTYPRTMVNSDGNKVVFFYNRQIESSGLVTNDPTGARVPMSVITGAMLYNGGPIQTAPKIYVDHWGNWGSTGDPDGVGNYYQSFISGVGGSSWMGTVTQYTQSGGAHVGNASGSYAGVWNDTTNAIPSLTRSGSYQSNLAAEAKRAAAHFGDYSVSASYVIMVPHGTRVYGFGTSYCAWHSDVAATGGTIAYTNLPYIPDAGSSCGAGSVNSPGTNDGVSIVGGHEQAETETDPNLNAWYDSGGNEIGDKCAWVSLQNTSFSTGSFPTQPLWSNSANGCVQ